MGTCGDQLPPAPEAAPTGEITSGGLKPIEGSKVVPGKTGQQPSKTPAPQPGTSPIGNAQIEVPQPDGKVTQLAVKPTSIYIQAGAFLLPLPD